MRNITNIYEIIRASTKHTYVQDENAFMTTNPIEISITHTCFPKRKTNAFSRTFVTFLYLLI